jgi:hypothetical protein
MSRRTRVAAWVLAGAYAVATAVLAVGLGLIARRR